MTIKSKTVFATDNQMRNLETIFMHEKLGAYKNEITISWKEERKAEVTESQIDEITKEWCGGTVSFKYEPLLNFIKEQIFKEVK